MKKLFLIIGLLILATSLCASSKNKTIYFKSCKEARAAGYSDIKKEEPGYSPNLEIINLKKLQNYKKLCKKFYDIGV